MILSKAESECPTCHHRQQTIIRTGDEILFIGKDAAFDREHWGGAEMATVHVMDQLRRQTRATIRGLLGAVYDPAAAVAQSEAERIALVSVCTAVPQLCTLRDKRVRKRILMLHDPNLDNLGMSPRTAAAIVNKVVCVSETLRQQAVQQGMPAEKCVVIRNGVDHNIFYPRTPYEDRETRLLFVGALVPHKGFDLLVEALREINARIGVPLECDVCGCAGMWGAAEPAIPSVPGLHIHGFKTQFEVAEYMRRAALLIMPSRWFESSPLTLLEAFACGCPVLASNLPGISETGGTAVEYIGDKLSSDIIRLIANSGRLKAMSSQGIMIASNHCWERAGHQLGALINE